jgi:hypothetical protein
MKEIKSEMQWKLENRLFDELTSVKVIDDELYTELRNKLNTELRNEFEAELNGLGKNLIMV